MNTSTELASLIVKCRLACGAEAVARGFPQEAGYDMYDGCCADDIEGWSEQQFLDWTYRMDKKYGCDSSVTLNPLMKLYEACSQIMSSYGDKLQKLEQENKR